MNKPHSVREALRVYLPGFAGIALMAIVGLAILDGLTEGGTFDF